MPLRIRVPLIAVVCLLATAAVAWEVPSHWAELGTVDEWMRRDGEIWRFEGDAVFNNQSQKNVDQQRVYAETHTYLGSVDGISLADFLALDQASQQDRIKAARKHRDYLLRFRTRMDTYVNQSRADQVIGWGTNISDVTTVGEHLTHLRSAVAVDPANVYAWHIYALFCSIAGDVDRALGALDGAEAALAEVPEGELKDVRVRVALDRAWLLRDKGDIAGATEALDSAVAIGAPNVETTLLSGLLAVAAGDTRTAVDLAKSLRSVEIRKFPTPITGASAGFWRPERTNLGAWMKEPSNYLQSWIMALVWLQEGQPEMLGKAFRKYSVKDIYPLGWRFWREAGRIYEVSGRPELANQAWRAARVWAPYSAFYPVKIYAADLSRLTGRPSQHAVYLAYDRFYVGGQRLVPGAILAQAAAGETDEMKRLELAGQAMDELESCRAAGTYPAQASLLLGSVYYQMGDVQSAVIEVESALELLESEGDAPGYAAVLDELANVSADHSVTGVQEFYGQSGAAQSRWAPTVDPAAERAALLAAYDADPNDENRQALARYLVRHDEAEAGRDLVAEHAAEAGDMVLLLEAERALGETARAEDLVAGLRAGDDPYDDAEVWALAGFICLDEGLTEDARIALERALELDPGNHALRLQMRLLG